MNTQKEHNQTQLQCKKCGRTLKPIPGYSKSGWRHCPCGHVATAAHSQNVRERLEYLRGELRTERISWGDLHELQSLASHIEAGDVELLEAAGVPEQSTAADAPEAPQTVQQLNAIRGFRLLAHSSNGAFEVCSYIAKRNGRKVYGYYSHIAKRYIESKA